MANKNLFQTMVGRFIPPATALNEELAPAYRLSPKHELAQYAATGCLNGTFYASAETQLERVLELCGQVDPMFVAKTAVYAREQGRMKDMPALLCAALSVVGPDALTAVFPRVIDNGKMLRNFVQIMRSGVVARKSLGSLPKRLVLEWLASREDDTIFRESVGSSPSLADIVKMVHPKPLSESRKALYGRLIGREHDASALPELVRTFDAFKRDPKGTPPDVPFQMLTSLPLDTEQWCGIARNASWQMTRMNLNTFARHGVLERPELVRLIARRLSDSTLVKKANAFPYQLLMAYRAAGSDVPAPIREALQDAMEIAIENVPRVEGKVYVLPDVSGSMQSPVTGFRKGSTTAARCIDVAALVAAAMLRRNPEAQVIPFEHSVVDLRLNPRDSVMTNARLLASVGGGGTNCSAPLAWLNARKAKGDVIVYVSDNESWVDARRSGGTETMHQWAKFQQRNPKARLVCIDLQPYGTTQASERADILNVGGFSDAVFELVTSFAAGRLDPNHWVGVIDSVQL